jgi:hypothetical protein
MNRGIVSDLVLCDCHTSGKKYELNRLQIRHAAIRLTYLRKDTNHGIVSDVLLYD